jgi:hypothetical protein
MSLRSLRHTPFAGLVPVFYYTTDQYEVQGLQISAGNVSTFGTWVQTTPEPTTTAFLVFGLVLLGILNLFRRDTGTHRPLEPSRDLGSSRVRGDGQKAEVA